MAQKSLRLRQAGCWQLRCRQSGLGGSSVRVLKPGSGTATPAGARVAFTSIGGGMWVVKSQMQGMLLSGCLWVCLPECMLVCVCARVWLRVQHARLQCAGWLGLKWGEAGGPGSPQLITLWCLTGHHAGVVACQAAWLTLFVFWLDLL